MSVPLWAAELAAAFWEDVGEREPFPRSLRRSIASALPLSVVLLPKLCVSSILDWLHDCGIVCQLRGADRPLRACLVARYGHGIAFLDGADCEDEQRFSLAHELAHFLRDYWQPRRIAGQRLGLDVLQVLDGQRPPDSVERVSALLRHTPIGFHTHLMDREDGFANSEIEERESGADRLAFELLAPADHVLANGHNFEPGQERAGVVDLLRSYYQLPCRQAAVYAAILIRSERPVDPLLKGLRVGN